MATNKTNLQNLAHKLDSTVGGIGLATETLEDISTSLLQVVEEMDNLPKDRDLRIYHDEWHRHLRILSKLMYHATNDLTKENNELYDTSHNMYDEIHEDDDENK